MKYLLIIRADEAVHISSADDAAIARDTIAWVKEMDDRGVRLAGHRVRPVSDATSVRVRDDQVLITDGPFAEAKEQMAGYDVIECTDLDEAIEVASKHPMARVGLIEVRPFWEIEEVQAAVAAAYREEWGRIVATLIRVTGDWSLAEECAQDAFARALERWPHDGVPHRPGVWLTTTARNRAMDRLRRAATEAIKLRALAGLTTAEIARAFLVPEPTMAQRLVRAKRKIRNAGIPYQVPPGPPAAGAHGRGAGGAVPAVQRGLHRHRRAGAAAAGAQRRGDLAGPAAGHADARRAGGARPGYHLLPATRADLLRRLGRAAEAAAAYRRALQLVTTDTERRYLIRRLTETSRED